MKDRVIEIIRRGQSTVMEHNKETGYVEIVVGLDNGELSYESAHLYFTCREELVDISPSPEYTILGAEWWTDGFDYAIYYDEEGAEKRVPYNRLVEDAANKRFANERLED